MYYLIAVYCFLSTAALFAFTRTPLGRMLNAVRDNPERVEFIGYSTQHVRYLAFMVSGFFAGIAGGLGALNLEIVTAEVVGAARSGAYLLFVFLGGATFFFGPIIGAVMMVLAQVLSEFTKAWVLYLGLLFLFMVMYAPGGVASLLLMNLRLASFGKLRELWTAYLALGGTAFAMLAGAGAMVEMIYHLQLNSALGPELQFLGTTLNATSAESWFGAAMVAAVGLALFELARRRYMADWERIQEEIEKEIKRREAIT
jgi:branched-chain amino acid transport system permease protein